MHVIVRYTKAERQKILADKGGKCAKCGRTYDLSLDHITPICRGGSVTEENIQILCWPCHQAKSSLDGSHKKFPSLTSFPKGTTLTKLL